MKSEDLEVLLRRANLSRRSKDVIDAIAVLTAAKERARSVLGGLNKLDFEYGLKDDAFQHVSSVELVMKALKHNPSVTKLDVNSAFAMLPTRAQTRFRSPRCMGAAIRILKKNGVIRPSGNPGEWVVRREKIV